MSNILNYLTIQLFSLLTLITVSANALAVEVIVLNERGKPLKEIIVYLAPLENQSVINPKKNHHINQLNKTFAPYITVSQIGNQVHFYNQDDITHHIYSTEDSNKFSFKIRADQTHIKKDFIKTGSIAMGCNIHDWMSGYLLIIDTPYYGETNAMGLVNLTVTEPGRYQLTAWHPQLNEANNRLSQEISLPSTDKTIMQLNMAMDVIPTQESDENFDFLSDY